MKAEYINPFLGSVHDLFTKMLNAKVMRQEVGVVRGTGDCRDVVALIGFGGPARGMVAMAFPAQTALKIVEQLLGMKSESLDETVRDALAEVVNIVAGGAKAKLVQGDQTPIDLSLPTIVMGNDFNLEYPSKTMWLEVPFKSDLGPFAMRITFEMNGKGTSS